MHLCRYPEEALRWHEVREFVDDCAVRSLPRFGPPFPVPPSVPAPRLDHFPLRRLVQEPHLPRSFDVSAQRRVFQTQQEFENPTD